MFIICFLVLRIKNRLRIACNMLYHVYFLTVFRKTKHSLVIFFSFIFTVLSRYFGSFVFVFWYYI